MVARFIASVSEGAEFIFVLPRGRHFAPVHGSVPRRLEVTPLILKDGKLLKDRCYVAGEWIGGSAAISVTNPADDSVIGQVPKLGAAETRAAIKAAEKAQKHWAKKTAKERAAILRKWFDMMIENHEDLARIMTAEQGKPLANPAVKSPTGHPSLSSSQRKASAFMARRSPPPGRLRGWSSSSSRLGLSQPLPRGTSQSR